MLSHAINTTQSSHNLDHHTLHQPSPLPYAAHLHYLHDIFQRFYYLPILLAALWFGFRGGLSAARFLRIPRHTLIYRMEEHKITERKAPE